MYKLGETIRTAYGQDGAVALDIRQGRMFNLNLVGSRILELLQDGSTESEIANQISREFNVGRDVAGNDLQEFLQTLNKYHLVEQGEPGVRI
jgi:hypothetical protein